MQYSLCPRLWHTSKFKCSYLFNPSWMFSVRLAVHPETTYNQVGFGLALFWAQKTAWRLTISQRWSNTYVQPYCYSPELWGYSHQFRIWLYYAAHDMEIFKIVCNFCDFCATGWSSTSWRTGVWLQLTPLIFTVLGLLCYATKGISSLFIHICRKFTRYIITSW